MDRSLALKRAHVTRYLLLASVWVCSCSSSHVSLENAVDSSSRDGVMACDGTLNRDGVKLCGGAPEVVHCGSLTSVGEGACSRVGEGRRIVLRGDVLAFDKTYAGGSVVIEDDRITYVGCDPDLSDATVITCPDSVISPGLINAHDHIGYSNSVPASWGDERFDHRHDWRKGLNGHTKVAGPTTEHNDVPELRQLLSGTTSLFGSGNVDGLLRNLDKASPDGRDQALPIYQTFPLSDHTGVQIEEGCHYSKYASDFSDSCPYGPHIGEGINRAAHNELVCLSSDEGRDIFKSNLAVIHGVAATPDIMQKMAERNVKLVWSPRTNIALYGDTANITAFDRLGVTIGMGTDWIYSGSANMLRELQCADSFNSQYLGHHFSDYELWLMPTVGSAAALGLSHVIGRLWPGYVADIAMYRKSEGRQAHRAVIEAQNADVQLVMLGGKLLYGDAEIMTDGAAIDVCGSAKKFDSAQAGSRGYAEIESDAQYPLFFCGEPENEPTCTPRRVRPEDTSARQLPSYGGAGTPAVDLIDSDGDGISDEQDNCPNVFNPIRPQDLELRQRDTDGDGVGDACDAWPTCFANDATCIALNAHDLDSDGVPNFFDNCPNVANADQLDTDNDGLGDACDLCDDSLDRDGDGIGDACDACPDDPLNEDGHGCSLAVTPISALRAMHIAGRLPESLVKTEGIVTAIVERRGNISGIFIQDEASSSGVMLYNPEHVSDVAVGDKVSVKGSTTVYYSLVEIKPTQVTKLGVSSLREPVVLTVAQAIDQTDSEVTKNPFDSVLVTVKRLHVDHYDDANRVGECYMAHDDQGNSLCIDDYVMGAEALAKQLEVGRTYDVTGILLYEFGREKIAPRNAGDIQVR